MQDADARVAPTPLLRRFQSCIQSAGSALLFGLFRDLEERYDSIEHRWVLLILLFALLWLAACRATPAPTPAGPTNTPTITRTKAPTATPTITPTPEPPKSRNPGALIYLTEREPETLDPHVDYTSAGAGVLSQHLRNARHLRQSRSHEVRITVSRVCSRSRQLPMMIASLTPS